MLRRWGALWSWCETCLGVDESEWLAGESQRLGCGFSISWSAIEGGVPVAISRHHTTATAVTKDRNVANVVSRCGLSVRHLWPFLAAAVNASGLTLSFRA